MNSNQPDPVIGVANPSMSFFQKHTRFQSLAGNRAPLNSIAITPFLQTLFTIPAVVSPSPQTAGLVLDGEDKIDPNSPAESSYDTLPSSVPSDTAKSADDECNATETDAVESTDSPVHEQPSEQAAVAAPEYTPAPALVPDSAWIDESLNAPVSPGSILALPNRLPVGDLAVDEDAASVVEHDIAPPVVAASAEPASPTMESPAVDPTWMDSDLLAPVTPASILALPEKTTVAAIQSLEKCAADAVEDATATEIPTPVQTTSSPEKIETRTALVPDNAWMDASLNAPVTPYSLLALPEKNITFVNSPVTAPPPSAPIQTVQVSVPSPEMPQIIDEWIAPVTPLALLALPEKNCTSTVPPLSEPPLIASAFREEPDMPSPWTRTTNIDEDSDCDSAFQSLSAFTNVTEPSFSTGGPRCKLDYIEDEAWEDDFVASGTPPDPVYTKLLCDATFLVPQGKRLEQEELTKLSGRAGWEARRLMYASKGLVLKLSST
ncbi:hypothetical protein QBC40DRAFT_275579 [Triangularia verruculosa]|uniref:Uncharacterized protein n=1 Tax=Triangularia verruculosa TaxID=2587418 RepID=A0AAN6XLJ6_9PEZI|nr:hypothetical protein QBC40DRAFT_275579 [Triangularia verruculosa]